MPLHNPKGLTERIEIYGDIGTMKTSSWMTIAKWAQTTGSDAKFYCIDTDYAVYRMLNEGDEYTGLANLDYTECADWGQVMAATEKYLARIRPQDLLVVDFVSETWAYVQSWYSREVYKKGIDLHFMEVRKQIQDSLGDSVVPGQVQPYSGYADWKVINSNYFAWRDSILKHNRFNVFTTARWKQLDKKESEHTLTYYGRMGYKPEGQKDVEGLMHTVIYSRFDGDNWYMTSIKDRKRAKMTDKQIKDFVLGYLVPNAGWRLK